MEDSRRVVRLSDEFLVFWPYQGVEMVSLGFV